MQSVLRNHFKFILVLFALFQIRCGSDTPPPPPSPSTSESTLVVPKFSRDSAYNYIAKQVEFGPRVPNSEAHQACKRWLVEQFKTFGATVIEQDFEAAAYDDTILKGTNIIAQYNPQAKKRILLAAHWDSRHIADSPINEERRNEPILGADDGGSGVGVLIEIARQLQANPIENMGVDIVLFDAEDYGEDNDQAPNLESWALGSQYWAKHLHVSNYKPKYGILLDMVGAKNAQFPKEEYSMGFAPNIVNKVWKLAQDRGYTNYFTNASKRVGVDDHVFVNRDAKIPMIDIINMPDNSPHSFGGHWHTHGDDMSIISKKTLGVVGRVMMEVIYREAAGKF